MMVPTQKLLSDMLSSFWKFWSARREKRALIDEDPSERSHSFL